VLLGKPTQLKRGDSTGCGQRTLSVGSATLVHFTGNFTTDGAAVSTSYFIHINNPITGDSLLTATLQGRLQLQSVAPAGPLTTLPDLIFNIRFLETSYATPCIASGRTPCDDIFVSTWRQRDLNLPITVSIRIFHATAIVTMGGSS
jgi:hypothetical protein